jgi:predicted acylesterase/phospholipase RssA/CRP-like cAMP-binding protein
MSIPTHVNTLLFEGLTAADLSKIQQQMRPCHFEAGEVVCREGEPGSSLFVIQSGAMQVVLLQYPLTDRSNEENLTPLPDSIDAGDSNRIIPNRSSSHRTGARHCPYSPDGFALGLSSRNSGFTGRSLGRLRHGDVVGEMSLLTGEPRSATVVASLPTTALELTQDVFATLLLQYPTIVTNLSRILSRRLAHSHERQQVQQHQRETIALVIDQRGRAYIPTIIAATRSASPRDISMLDLTGTLHTYEQSKQLKDTGSVLALLDEMLLEYPVVIVVVNNSQEDLIHLLQQVDRVVAVMDATEAAQLTGMPSELVENIELVLLTEEPGSVAQNGTSLRIIHTCDLHRPDRDLAWLGRHLARTKVGLALGAGGARGYAHIAVLQRLEEEGYTVDYIGGSSIGALIGSWLAMGKDASAIEAAMHRFFSPETVEALFRLALSGMSAGYEVLTRLCYETAADTSFAGLALPLLVMTADLNTRRPVPIREGSLWEALLAALALPGMFPPYIRGEQRLVDGLTLVPVPARAVAEMGADITISVNLLSREVLANDLATPFPPHKNTLMLETLLEALELMQMEASIRSAARADVVITPRFGAQTWRDFHLSDLFLAAGRRAFDEQLTTLNTLARPQRLMNVASL